MADYANLIIGVDPTGPYFLLGYSAGGNLAYHVAAELERRGREVSDIVMIDSGRVMGRIIWPEGETERVATRFLGHESVRPYLTSILLREKACRKIDRYYAYIAGSQDYEVVDANIHLLVSNKTQEYHNPVSGELIVSPWQWSKITRGAFRTYLAGGDHNFMLHDPHLEYNARLIRSIFEQARSSPYKNPVEPSLRTGQ